MTTNKYKYSFFKDKPEKNAGQVQEGIANFCSLNKNNNLGINAGWGKLKSAISTLNNKYTNINKSFNSNNSIYNDNGLNNNNSLSGIRVTGIYGLGLTNANAGFPAVFFIQMTEKTDGNNPPILDTIDPNKSFFTTIRGTGNNTDSVYKPILENKKGGLFKATYYPDYGGLHTIDIKIGGVNEITNNVAPTIEKLSNMDIYSPDNSYDVTMGLKQNLALYPFEPKGPIVDGVEGLETLYDGIIDVWSGYGDGYGDNMRDPLGKIKNTEADNSGAEVRYNNLKQIYDKTFTNTIYLGVGIVACIVFITNQ